MDANKTEGISLAASHEKLVALGQRRFSGGFPPHQVVTFLNQVLRDRGLIAGIRQTDGEYELTIYDCGDGRPS